MADEAVAVPVVDEVPAPPAPVEDVPAPVVEVPAPVEVPVSEPVVVEAPAPVTVEEVPPPASIIPEAVVVAEELAPVPVVLEEVVIPEVVAPVDEAPPAPILEEKIIEVPIVVPEEKIEIISLVEPVVEALSLPTISENSSPSIVEEVKKMAPPKFDDLGKEAKDLVNKNFHFGVIKLEAKTKAKNGVDFTTEGSHNTDTGNVAGSLETKFKYADYGVTFSEKWNTDNIIATTITVDDKIAKGLKVDFDTTFAPITGKKSAKVKTAYSGCEFLHCNADVDFDFAGPTVHGSGVFAYKGWHAGYQASYDTANSKLTANNVSLTYKDGDFVLHSGIIDASKYVGSVHHQVNSNLSAAALLNWTSGSTTSNFTVAGKYTVDGDTYVKAKLDNNLRFGLSYVQNLRPGIQLTMSSLINAKSLEQGGHKLGLSLNFDA
jgi:voltage-dependent anion channel protein 2